MMQFNPPAELPANLKDQLQALAPYMRDFRFKGNGGFIVELTVPIDIITAYDPDQLATYGISLCTTINAPENVFGRADHRPQKYVEITMEYR